MGVASGAMAPARRPSWVALALAVVALLGPFAESLAEVPTAVDVVELDSADVTDIATEDVEDRYENLGEGLGGPAPLDPFQALGKNATKNATKVEDRGQNPFPAPTNGIKVDYNKRSGSDGTRQNATAPGSAAGSAARRLGEGAGSGSGSYKKYESLFMANGTLKAPAAADLAKATTILNGIKDAAGSGNSPAEVAASIESVASNIMAFAHANQEPKDSPHPGAPV